MRFARFEVAELPGPDTVTIRAQLTGAQGFAKDIDLLVLSRLVSRDVVELFVERGTRLAELADGNLLQIVEVGYEQGRAFLATEASSGVPISELLARCKELGLESMPTPIALGVGVEVAKALVHAHAHTDTSNRPDPITHGGLRSESITIGEDGAVKLGGFQPLRAARSIENDVDQLVELVSQWVRAADVELVREAAGNSRSATELRKAWAAHSVRHWPGVTNDVRRTFFAFATSAATREVLEANLGFGASNTSATPKVVMMGVLSAIFVAGGWLWLAEEPPVEGAVVPPPKPLVAAPKALPPPVPTDNQPGAAYRKVLEVDASADNLRLPSSLPGFSFHDDVWFNEVDPKDARAPQLFVVETRGVTHTIATVPLRPWHMPGATELRFFSWEPFDTRYRPGLRSIVIGSQSQQMLPLVQKWMEVEIRGAHVQLPPHRQLVITATLKSDVVAARGPILVAMSYGDDAPPADDPRWPYQLTRLALTNGQTSPTIDDARELEFIVVDPSDRYVVTIEEGSNSRDELWIGAKNTVRPARGAIRVEPTGYFEGWESSDAVEFMGSCGDWPKVSHGCIEQCLSRFKESLFCWRLYTEAATSDRDKERGANAFWESVMKYRVHGHPWSDRARSIILEAREKAQLETVPHSRP